MSIALLNETISVNTTSVNVTPHAINSLQNFAEFWPLIFLVFIASIIISLLRCQSLMILLKKVFGIFSPLIVYFIEGIIWTTLGLLIYQLGNVINSVNGFTLENIKLALIYGLAFIGIIITITLIGYLMSILTKSKLTKALLEIWSEIKK